MKSVASTLQADRQRRHWAADHFGVASVGVYGVALAGWSSNSECSMLGGLRASAQMVKLITLGLSLIGILIYTGAACALSSIRRPAPGWASFLMELVAGTVCRLLYLHHGSLQDDRIPFDFAKTKALSSPDTTPVQARSSCRCSSSPVRQHGHEYLLASILFLGGWSRPSRTNFALADTSVSFHRACVSSFHVSLVGPRTLPHPLMTSSWPSAGSFFCRWPWPSVVAGLVVALK